MGQQSITSERWLAGVAAVDDNPAVRVLARQTLEELRALRKERNQWQATWIATVVDRLDAETAKRLRAQIPALLLGGTGGA